MRSVLSRPNVYHLGEIPSRSQRNYKSRRVLGEISFISQKTLSYRRDLVCPAEVSFISARSRQYLTRDRFHLVPISETLQSTPSSWRDLGEISFISPRPQRHHQSRRVIGEISAKSRLSRRDLRGLQISPSSWRDLGEISFISPRPQRHYQSRRVIGEISAKSRLSRRDLRDITNLAEISSGLTRSRRDLCSLGQISLISPRSRRDRVEISATIQIWPRSRRVLVNLGDSPISARSRLNFCTGTASNLPASVGSRSVYIFAFQLHHKTSKGCHVYLSTRRPSVIDRLPRKATLFWHSWTECETKTLWRPRIIWKLECLIVLRLSKTEYCDGKYR